MLMTSTDDTHIIVLNIKHEQQNKISTQTQWIYLKKQLRTCFHNLCLSLFAHLEMLSYGQ